MAEETARTRDWSVAFERIVMLRADPASAPYPALPADPGRWHVYASAPVTPYRRALWRRAPARREPSAPTFFEQRGRRAACGVTIRAVLPRDGSVDDPDICPDCAQHLRDGTWQRTAPRPHFNARCDATVTVTAEDARRDPDHPEVRGGMVTFSCDKRYTHQDEHRAYTGETWLLGDDDFTPAPGWF